MHLYETLGQTVYFWFAANNTSGSGDDGATPLYDVRLGGAAASAIPVLSGSPTLLTHANYPAGCHEIAIAATTGNGFAAGGRYGVFCTLLVDSQNPAGFVGSFSLTGALATKDNVGIFREGTLASMSSASAGVLDSGAAYIADGLQGAILHVKGSTNAPYWQASTIATNTAAAGANAFTVDPAFDVQPTGTISYQIIGTAQAPTGTFPAVNIVQENGAPWVTQGGNIFERIGLGGEGLSELATAAQGTATAASLAAISALITELLASHQNAIVSCPAPFLTGTITLYIPGSAQTAGNILRVIPISRASTNEPFTFSRVS